MPECILYIMNIILHLITILYSNMLILRRAWYKVRLLQHSTHWNNKFLMYQGFHMRYCTNLILKTSYNHKMVINCNILFKNLFPQIWNELGPLKVLKSKLPKLKAILGLSTQCIYNTACLKHRYLQKRLYGHDHKQILIHSLLHSAARLRINKALFM